MELMSEEENNRSISDEEVDEEPLVDDRSDSESDIEADFSSLIIAEESLSALNLFQLLGQMSELMKKVRIFIKFIRNHNATNEFVIKQMQSKSSGTERSGRRIGGLVLDMVVRWNSSYLLFERLIAHMDILNGMCAVPESVPGLTTDQKRRLRELAITHREWQLLDTLKSILEPFVLATSVLSGQTYPTMATSFYVHRLISLYLQPSLIDDPIKQALKKSLRFWFHLYFEQKLPPGQMDTMMVSYLFSLTSCSVSGVEVQIGAFKSVD
jgi:hypothetical protein